MTKVTENGQLEWTFEELDFEGAFEDISIEITALLSVQSYLVDSRTFDLPDDIWNYLSAEFKKTQVRYNLLSKVKKYIIKLKWGENFND